MLEHTFRCPLARGIHARPASHLQSVAKAFTSSISIRNVRNSRLANAHSVFSLVGADIRAGDVLQLNVSGVDQDQAIEALRRHIENDLPHCDELPESTTTGSAERVLPYSLRTANATYLKGISAVAGAAEAVLCVAKGVGLPRRLNVPSAADPSAERAKFDRARGRLVSSIENQMRSQSDGVAGQILYVHQCMLNDEEFIETVASGIVAKHHSAAQAILEARERFTKTFSHCENVVINERALDVEDLCAQLLREIYGPSILRSKPVELEGPSILAVDHLTPSAFLSLDKDRLKGLVLGMAGTTSHTVILARARGIPTLVGLDLARIEPYAGREVVLDGTLGLFLPEPNEQVTEYYRLERIKHRLREDRVHALRHKEARSRDGVVLEVGANIACADDARVAFDAGADGVGLFRTEMLYMDRDRSPDEAEQLAVYADVLKAANGRPVVFRTLDVGGDKPVPCVTSSSSDLRLDGRGIQFYVEQESLFRTQLRALLRASVFGQARIMIPMVTTVGEVRWVKSVLDRVKSDLARDDVDHSSSTPLGAMVETPAAADIMDRLCEELDFFSIGTNDLAQYHLSVERAAALNPASACHPSLLRLLAQIVEHARQAGKWIGVCGEMAADGTMLPVWLGLGVSEISVTPTAIATLKAEVGNIAAQEARQLVPSLLGSADAEQARNLLTAFKKTHRRFPVVDPELIFADANASTKEQAIKILADRLYVAGRTDDPALLENAIWQREAAYSTGLGFGFAVPHCECDALLADTIAVMKLPSPVDWGSVDAEPVSVLIFLGRWHDDSGAHLQAFAKLSRCLMRADFRQGLRNESQPDRVASFLRAHLGAV